MVRSKNKGASGYEGKIKWKDKYQNGLRTKCSIIGNGSLTFPQFGGS